MQNIEKIRSSGQNIYDNLLEGAAEHVLKAICANRMTPFQVYMRYIDNAFEHENYHDWLEIEYPKPIQALEVEESVQIPCYETANDVVVMFETLPKREGMVDDEYLKRVGSITVSETVSVTNL